MFIGGCSYWSLLEICNSCRTLLSLKEDFACGMAKSARSRRRLSAHQFRSAPYPTSRPYCGDAREDCNLERTSVLERKDWDNATCPVCMEFPHNAVLLLCSSHDKGCRPYMCGTSYRHSNCLDQFKKAHTKVRCKEQDSIRDNPSSLGLTGPGWPLSGKSEVFELACPLCRGQVKGWTVVESARKCLNNKKRSCMKADCSFIGTYKELKKHVKSEHPCSKPREVDPQMEEKWRMLQLESEQQDVISTIMSSMPRSVVFGDYVIDMANSDVASEDETGNGDGGSEGRRAFSSSILYFLREGARLMRLQRDNGTQDSSGYGPPMDSINGVTDISVSSGGNESSAVTASSQGRGMNILRAERRQGRRRRSRGPSPFDVS